MITKFVFFLNISNKVKNCLILNFFCDIEIGVLLFQNIFINSTIFKLQSKLSNLTSRVQTFEKSNSLIIYVIQIRTPRTYVYMMQIWLVFSYKNLSDVKHKGSTHILQENTLKETG